MTDPSNRLKDFEQRLNGLKRKMEAGLADRAAELRGAVDRLLSGDEESRRDIKRLSHKLRGIAGTYGHQDLTELAGNVEQRASLSPPPVVAELARELADEAVRIGNGAAAAETALCERPPAAQKSGIRRPAELGKGTKLRVLAMDDDPNTLRLLRLTLEQIGGFEATLVESAKTALQELQNKAFDLVLSDAMMPDMNGHDFCRAARALGGRAAQTPIVILSAATADELGWDLQEGLPTSWLRKPFRPVELVQDLEAILAKRRQR